MAENEEAARNRAAALRIFKNTVGDLPPDQMNTREGREAAHSLVTRAIDEIAAGGTMIDETDFDQLLAVAIKRPPNYQVFKELKASLKDELPLIVEEKRVERAEIAIQNAMNTGAAGHPETTKPERDRLIAEALIRAGERDIEYVKKGARALEVRSGGLTFELGFIDGKFETDFRKQLGIMVLEDVADPQEALREQIRQDVKKIVDDCYNYRGMVIPQAANDEQVREIVLNEIDRRIMKMLLDAGVSKNVVKETFEGNYALIWSPERQYLNDDMQVETFLDRFDAASKENRARAKAEFEMAKRQSPEWKAAKIKQSERIRDKKVAKIQAKIVALEKERKTANPERQLEIDALLSDLTSKKFARNLWQMGYKNMMLSAETLQKVEEKLGRDWKKKILVRLATGFFPQGDVDRLAARQLGDADALALLSVIENTINNARGKIGAGKSADQRELSLANKTYWAGVDLAGIVGNAPFSDQFGLKLMAIRAGGIDTSIKDKDGVKKVLKGKISRV
jgi:hypothetical protein